MSSDGPVNGTRTKHPDLDAIRARAEAAKTPLRMVVMAHEALALLAEIERLREIIGDAVPALGSHARDFSQRALIAACEITGRDPGDWTQHPDVLARLLAAQPEAHRTKKPSECAREAEAS